MATKAEFWEYLRANPGFKPAKTMRRMFDIKDQRTLNRWANVPFIQKYSDGPKVSYQFIPNNEHLYLEAIGSSPSTESERLPVGPKNVPIPKEFIDGEPKFAVLLNTTGKQLHAYSLTQMENLANMDEPKLEWIKTAIIGLYDIRFNKGAESNMKALVAVMTDILKRNTFEDTKEAVDKLRASMAPAEESIEEIREMELADIMKHVPAGNEDKGFDINDPSSWN